MSHLPLAAYRLDALLGRVRSLIALRSQPDAYDAEHSTIISDFGRAALLDALMVLIERDDKPAGLKSGLAMQVEKVDRIIGAAQIGAIDSTLARDLLSSHAAVDASLIEACIALRARRMSIKSKIDAEDRAALDRVYAIVEQIDPLWFDEPAAQQGSARNTRTARIHTGWKVGDRACWNGEPRFGLPTGASASFRTAMAHVPTAEERRLYTTFEVTIKAERYGVPISVRADDGFTFDPSIDIDRLEPLIPLPTGEVASFADAVDNPAGVSAGFYGAQNPAPQMVGRADAAPRPLGSDRRWGQSIASGRFRLHFNRHGAAPFVWSVVPLNADGSPRMEIAVSEFHVGALRSVFQPKATSDDEDGKASAWLEVDGTLSIDEQGVARIEVGRE